jgi:cytosolic carboxypeptidase protein 5
MSREGSGRVAVFKLTGLVRCYTLECNYNTGRLVNTLPLSGKDHAKTPAAPVVPPKYNPPLFEEVLISRLVIFLGADRDLLQVGKAMAISILDLTGSNPWSRIRYSEFKCLPGIKDWLKRYIQTDLNITRGAVQRKSNIQVGKPFENTDLSYFIYIL